MNIWRFDNANSLYYALIDTLSQNVQEILAKGRKPTFALPTGNTAIPFYRLATENAEQLKVSEWVCFNVDEYFPIDDENAPKSFDAFMETHFYSRLSKPVHRREILNGRTWNPADECARYEKLIADAGGIDITILGIGTNGHIAFNEPGSEFDSRTRQVELHPETLMANFHGNPLFTHALTMGIGNIIESKKVYVIALGKNKAQAVKCSIKDPETRNCPASGLRRNPNVTWFLDQDAANLV